MSRTKDRLRDDMEMSLSDVIQSTSIKYDTVPFSIEEDYDSDTDDHPINMNKSRRWSILDKLERRSHGLAIHILVIEDVCVYGILTLC